MNERAHVTSREPSKKRVEARQKVGSTSRKERKSKAQIQNKTLGA